MQRENRILNQKLANAKSKMEAVKHDFESLENVSFQQITKLHKDQKASKAAIENLQCQLDLSVPFSELEHIQNQYNDLNKNYQKLLANKAQEKLDGLDVETLKSKISSLNEAIHELTINNEFLETQMKEQTLLMNKDDAISITRDSIQLKQDLAFSKAQIGLLEQKISYSESKAKNLILSERQYQGRINDLEIQLEKLLKDKISLDSQLNDMSLKLALSTPSHVLLNQSKVITGLENQIATLQEDIEKRKLLAY